MAKAKMIIYDVDTGDITEEKPLNFWFSFSEPEQSDRHFNIALGSEYDSVLEETQSQYIKITASSFFNEIIRALPATEDKALVKAIFDILIKKLNADEDISEE